MNSKRDLVVCLIGDDENYWAKLSKRIETIYLNWNFQFIRISTEELSNPQHLLIKLHDLSPQICYIDFDKHTQSCLSLCKLIFKDNVTKLISVTALHTENNSEKDMALALLTGVRINQIKCDELHDVIYDSISFADIDMSIKPDYITTHSQIKAEISQDLRVAYVNEYCIHVETNAPFKENDRVSINPFFLSKYINSEKLIVSNTTDKNLYYNQRYGLDLLFTFLDQTPLDYNDEKQNTVDLLPITDDFKNIENIQMAEEISNSVKLWMSSFGRGVTPKKVKVLVVDNDLVALRELDKSKASLNISINFQKRLMGDFYQIKRTLPHVIVFSFSSLEKDDLVEFEKLLDKIDELKDYDPIIASFGVTDSIKEKLAKFKYKKLLIEKFTASLAMVEKIVSIAQSKLENRFKEDEQRIYFSTQMPESIVQIQRDIEIISMTESILYFEFFDKIPPWTVFKISSPFKALLTVVPHKHGGEFSSTKNVYRCLINGLGEVEKQKLRQYIQTVMKRELS